MVHPSDQIYLFTQDIGDAWKEFYKLTGDKKVAAMLVDSTVKSINCDTLREFVAAVGGPAAGPENICNSIYHGLNAVADAISGTT